MKASIFVAAPLIAFVGAALLTWLLVKFAGRFVLDLPNDRSLHRHPVPRTGGIAIAVGPICAALFGTVNGYLLMLWAGLVLVSILDDRKGLSASIRFAAHILAAGLFIGAGHFGLSLPVALSLIVATAWTTNMYNFMDGSDGLAGGMAVIGFGAYAVLAMFNGEQSIATMASCIAAASLAFLCFNYHPAKIFMGDVGSIPLGFLAAALGIEGWHRSLWPLWFPVVVFSPFIVDATVTLFRRMLRGEKVWQAHREHYYQRLVLMGWGHLRTFYAEVALMLLASVIAISAAVLGTSWRVILLIALSVVFVAAAVWVDAQWAKRQRSARENP